MNVRFLEFLAILGMFFMLGILIYNLSIGMEKLFVMPKFM